MEKILFLAHSDKFWMHNENHLRDLLREIETYLGPFPDIYPNGDVSEVCKLFLVILSLKCHLFMILF